LSFPSIAVKKAATFWEAEDDSPGIPLLAILISFSILELKFFLSKGESILE
jgi:hypothetical protein